MQVKKQLMFFPDTNFPKGDYVFLPNQQIHQYKKDLVHLISVPELYLLRQSEMLILGADK